MRAEQFIKDHGLEKAREVVEGAPEWATVLDTDVNDYYRSSVVTHKDVDLKELKRLVESVDVIKDLEGIKGAKGTLAELVKLDWDEFEHRWIDGWMCTRSRLEQAITDYESIYGEGNE